MAGFTLSEIRTALADQLVANIDREINVRKYPGMEGGSPSIIIDYDGEEAISHWQTYGASGLSGVDFVLWVDLGGADPESHGIALDDFLSSGSVNGSSIAEALMSDTSLGLTGCLVRIGTRGASGGMGRIPISILIPKVGANV